MLKELQEPLLDKGIDLVWDDDVPALLRSRMDSTVRGARDLRNVIRRGIEDRIADLIIEADGERTFISYHGAEYRFYPEWFDLPEGVYTRGELKKYIQEHYPHWLGIEE